MKYGLRIWLGPVLLAIAVIIAAVAIVTDIIEAMRLLSLSSPMAVCLKFDQSAEHEADEKGTYEL